MYKVLFAEDELLVRLGLQNSIPWSKYQMELSALAENGIEAFRLFESIRPDVLITDLRMEGMDGVELVKRVRQIDKDCAIVVVSCMNDFETLVVDVYDKDEDVKTPFWSGVEFYNKLYREGLLDPDNFITQGEDLTEKYTKGQYLGGTVNWFYGTYNTNNKGTDKEYIALPSKLGWVNEPNKAGWTGKYLFVSSHSPNIERAVMVLDYLQSSEFARSAESGIEGRWEKGDDGKPHLTEDTMSMKTDSSRADEWKASGISDSGTDNLVGWDYNDVLPDGGLVNLWNDEDVMKANLTTAEQDLCKQFDIDLPSDLLKKRIEDGTSMDLSDANPTIRMCLEITPKNITRIDSNCIELTENALPGLVQAESDEAFQSAKEALLQQLADAGVEESIEWWQNAWETSKSSIDKLESK